jgi:lipopolysaccharide transport system ATP-binding protein
VAAHLEPEILIIDEVLAVGDIAFQNKCMGKMQDVSLAGRTVLFVSHNMPAVSRLCHRAILLQSGKLVKEGATPDVVGAYIEGALASGHTKEWDETKQAPGTRELKLLSLSINNGSDAPVSTVSVEEPVRVRLRYRVAVPDLKFRCAVIFNTQGTCAFASTEPFEAVREKPGVYDSVVNIPAHLLAEGEYTLGVSMFTSKGVKLHYVQLQDVVAFHVFDPMTGASARGDYAERLAGVVRPRLQWESPAPA